MVTKNMEQTEKTEEYAEENSNWYDKEADVEGDYNQITEYDITSAPNDFNVKTIYDFIESGVVKIPAFQRNYVWDKRRASKLIESLVMGLPVPQIFLYERARNKFEVIDGQQRLLSIYYFIKQRFPRKNKRTELRKVFEDNGGMPPEILEEDAYFEKFNLQLPAKLPDRPSKFHGLNYATLAEYKQNFDLRAIRTIIIKQNVPPDDHSAIFEIFNRLNSGGMNLKPQEIRSSLFHSDFYEMLYRINGIESWRRLLGIQYPDLHMKDSEFILRAFAMLVDGENYKPSMTRFLNTFSEKCKKLKPDKISYLEKLFSCFLDSCSGLPNEAFLSKNKQFSISMFDAVFYASCSESYKEQKIEIQNIESRKLNELKDDQDFLTACQSETASTANVIKRRERASAILLPV